MQVIVIIVIAIATTMQVIHVADSEGLQFLIVVWLRWFAGF